VKELIVLHAKSIGTLTYTYASKNRKSFTSMQAEKDHYKAKQGGFKFTVFYGEGGR
jgi:hypothetical protein